LLIINLGDHCSVEQDLNCSIFLRHVDNDNVITNPNFGNYLIARIENA
jgi:hypothetical protein